MGLGAAIGVGAAASLGGAALQASAASKAADEQAQTALQGQQLQAQMFNTAQTQLQPFINAGAGEGLTQLQSQVGQGGALDSFLSPTGTLSRLVNPGTAMSTLKSLPGFQFQSKWGNLQAQNALSAQGLGGSAGPVGKALSDYNQGLASTYYQNAVQNQLGYGGALQNYAGSLQNFVNTGANSASALAGSAISSGNSQAQSLQAAGNAQASGTLGSANAISGGLNSAGSAISQYALLSKLLPGLGPNSTASTPTGSVYGGS